MGKQRKTWTLEQPLTMGLAAWRDEPSVAALARQDRGSEPQIDRWNVHVLEGGRQALDGAKALRVDQRLPSAHDQLKKLLGEKALEVDILQKLSSL